METNNQAADCSVAVRCWLVIASRFGQTFAEIVPSSMCLSSANVEEVTLGDPRSGIGKFVHGNAISLLNMGE